MPGITWSVTSMSNGCAGDAASAAACASSPSPASATS